ncbi:Glutamate dehydrogenase [Limihaloglobus sulfuriphilus]|uniref:Glutamate dehydrogenase n=1 Tax=Limihaloglobus sulfuriphilus TaxID=1851148 RepID=A0A1Q2MJ21_9BACT|nr:Glu/Leu/Phe/Val dehydrogenase [Limihaloglobus sulfuriphilus]AQQ72377.1 Glutamate dehydrogenase [Limihaloglobus sulfuriphilus]
MSENVNVYGICRIAEQNFLESASRLKLEDSMVQRLINPKEKLEISLNPALSNGKTVHLKSFIVRHNSALGPCKGGIRFTGDVTMEDVQGLAMEMTWKTSLIGVPFGGGKSGIKYDQTGLGEVDKETIIRSFTRAAMRHIGPEIYVPAPDIGTNETDMGHIKDCIAYSWGKSTTDGCFVTGKPVILGGIEKRREATGRGVVYSTAAACKALGRDISQMRVAVQGFGNVGSAAAEIIAAEYGAKVIAVSDINGGVFNAEGLDIKSLIEYCKKTGGVTDFPGSENISGSELLETDCDILIPAATQSQITLSNCKSVKADIIAEGANAPTDPQADEVLSGSGKFIIPDILCNAGGVFVSYLEYTQETQREQMTGEMVCRRLKKRMESSFKEVYEYSNREKITMRQAAMDIAVKRVVEATKAMGALP